MACLYILIPFMQWLALAAAQVYTGFNYADRWSEYEPKHTKDFVRQFNLAKSLPNTPYPFDSARLFTCIQHMGQGEPIEAFDAAIETTTSLLLGFWAQNEIHVDAEIAALDKAFKKHGAKLADLIVGLSVGNEDIYRHEKGQNMGASESQVKSLVQIVREKIAQSSFAKFMEHKPIGHTDIQDYVPSGMDFIGMNTYPYYKEQSYSMANRSFFDTLADVKRRAGDTPVWIGETGWPFSGGTLGSAVPSAENMQKYWTEVGCFLFGEYNVWWFQLEKDSPDGADWGLIDIASQKPRILDLSCPNIRSIIGEPPVDPSVVLPNNSPSTTPTTPAVPANTSLAAPSSPVSATSMTFPTLSHSVPLVTDLEKLTVYKTTTIYLTVTATTTQVPTPLTPAAESTTQAPSTTDSILYSYITDCLTVADISSNGNYVSVAINTGVSSACAPAPPFTGLPYNPTLTGTPNHTAFPIPTISATPTALGDRTIPSTDCETLFEEKENGQFIPVLENLKVGGRCADPPIMTPVASLRLSTPSLTGITLPTPPLSSTSADATGACPVLYMSMENGHYVPVVAAKIVSGVCAYSPTHTPVISESLTLSSLEPSMTPDASTSSTVPGLYESQCVGDE